MGFREQSWPVRGDKGQEQKNEEAGDEGRQDPVEKPVPGNDVFLFQGVEALRVGAHAFDGLFLCGQKDAVYNRLGNRIGVLL